MREKDLKPVLELLLKLLDRNIFKWRLDGSVNLFVQGIEVSPNDLDIVVGKEGMEIFKNVLRSYISRDYYSYRLKARSLICDMRGVKVEINCYENPELDLFEKVNRVNWNGLVVPVLPLRYAKEVYRKIGKSDKVELIDNSIKG